MEKFTNNAPGARGVRMKDGTTTFIDAGATVDLEESQIEHVHEDIAKGDRAAKVQADKFASGQGVDMAEVETLKAAHARELNITTARAEKAEADLAEALDKIASLEADLAEVTKPTDLPGLTGKNKAELLAIAKDEGAQVAEDATNAQIVEAIEAKRAG